MMLIPTISVCTGMYSSVQCSAPYNTAYFILNMYYKQE